MTRSRGDWRERHLRCCLTCGRVWRPRRRKTCPNCKTNEAAFCLTCDRFWPEEAVRDRCDPPGEEVRRFVKLCGGDWDSARHILRSLGGNLPRAIVAMKRHAERTTE